MARITIRIFQRDGVTLNLLYEELERMEYKAESDLYVVLVETHKGSRKHGAARVSMTKEMKDKMMTFAYKVRVLLPGTEALFQASLTNKDPSIIYDNPLTRYVNAPWPTKGGTGKMQSGSNTKVLTRELQRIDYIQKGTTITSNDVRKSGVTVCEQIFPGNAHGMRTKHRCLCGTVSVTR